MRVIPMKYEIEFWDHAVGPEAPIKCRVLGYILDEDKLYMKLSFWLVETDCEATYRNNLEPFAILKSAIIKKRRLK